MAMSEAPHSTSFLTLDERELHNLGSARVNPKCTPSARVGNFSIRKANLGLLIFSLSLRG